jgi:hypothetical protein
MRLIAGSGRSGTTWVQDALANANALRPVFEPLHPAVSEIGARYAYRALAPDDEHPDLQRFFSEVCAGASHAMWTRYRGRPDLLFPAMTDFARGDSAKRVYRRWKKFLSEAPALAAASRRPIPLVKCIRANLMLGWLARRMNCRTVFVVRHPGAVIESHCRLGSIWDPGPVLRRFRSDAQLHEMTADRYRSLLARRLSYIEGLAVCWLIENQSNLEHTANDAVTIVHYEDLRASPEVEWARIGRSLDLPGVPDADVRARPSQQSSTDRNASFRGSPEVPQWMLNLSQEQAELIQAVLDETRFDLYSMRDARPRVPIDERRNQDMTS